MELKGIKGTFKNYLNNVTVRSQHELCPLPKLRSPSVLHPVLHPVSCLSSRQPVKVSHEYGTL